MTASLPSSLTSAGRGTSAGRSTRVMAPKGQAVKQMSQPMQRGRVDDRGRRAAPAGAGEEVVDLAGHGRGLGVALHEGLGAGRRAATKTPSRVVSVARFLRSRISMKPSSSRSTCSTSAMRRVSLAGTMPLDSTTRSGRSSRLARRRHVLDLDHRPAVLVELHLGRRAAQELDPGAPRRRGTSSRSRRRRHASRGSRWSPSSRGRASAAGCACLRAIMQQRREQ